jgi:hypothetical protein
MIMHDFKNFMAHEKLWHAMTNIGAINSRQTKTYGVTKNHYIIKWHGMSSSHGRLNCC